MDRERQPIVLTLQRGALALPAMRIVTGWLGSQNAMPLERLDDVNLALETLVTADTGESGELSLIVTTDDDGLSIVVKGLTGKDLLDSLVGASRSSSATRGWPLDINLFLKALVDQYFIDDSGADTFSVSMRKRFC